MITLRAVHIKTRIATAPGSQLINRRASSGQLRIAQVKAFAQQNIGEYGNFVHFTLGGRKVFQKMEIVSFEEYKPSQSQRHGELLVKHGGP